MYFPPKA